MFEMPTAVSMIISLEFLIHILCSWKMSISVTVRPGHIFVPVGQFGDKIKPHRVNFHIRKASEMAVLYQVIHIG
jgi:hypothetical protein